MSRPQKIASPITARNVWRVTESLCSQTSRYQPDCTHCHMPAAASTDVAHTQVTDHRIPRRAGIIHRAIDRGNPAYGLRLIPFPDSAEAEHDSRDLALAWQALANDGMESAEPHAEALLRSAVAEFPDDPDCFPRLPTLSRSTA